MADKNQNIDWSSSFFTGKKAEIAEYGYSRDHRSDKKQVTWGISTGINGASSALTIQNGNVQDKKHFNETYRMARRISEKGALFIFDCGANTADNKKRIVVDGFNYLTLKPKKLNAYKKYLFQFKTEENIQFKIDDREYTTVKIKEGDEYALRWQSLLLDRKDSQNILCKFTKYFQSLVYLHSGEHISLFALFNPVNKEFKYLVTNKSDATIEEVLRLWRIRWLIEEFHKDAKNLGLGEYQLRKLTAVLIHGRLLQMAYSILKRLTSMGTLLFGQTVSTIGECSRKLKELLFHTSRKWLLKVYA